MGIPFLLRAGARRLRSASPTSLCLQVDRGSPPSPRIAHSSSFLSGCMNSFAQPTSEGMREGLRGVLSQPDRRFAESLVSGAIRRQEGLVANSLFSTSGFICNAAKERLSPLLATMPRSPDLPRQTILWNVDFRKQCISTEMFPKGLKFPSERLKQPIDSLNKTASRYKEAAGLQVEAFWKRNFAIVVGAGGILACFLLWRIMFGVANVFVGFSEGMAKFGFLAMAAATVAFTGMMLRARFTINPDKIYRIAMRKLNTSAAALEVLGPPLSGTDVRAYVMSSGGLQVKKLKPRLGSKRCFLMFPIRGSERRGLVSAEVKKKKGQYDFKLLAIDVANPGADKRIFIIGDEVEYKVGGGLISVLRDPIVKAMAAEKEFEAQDEKEDEEEKKEKAEKREQELKEEEARRNEENQRLERSSAG